MITLTKNDIMLLKNFSDVNPSILFVDGNVQSVRSKLGQLIAVAEFDMDFPREFALFDLNKFLQVYGLVESTGSVQIEVGENVITVFNETTKQGLLATSKTNITPTVRTEPKIDPDIEFEISEADLVYAKKSASINGFEDLMFRCDGKDVHVVTYNAEVPNSEQHTRKIGEYDKNFEIIISISNMVLLNDDYYVKLYKKSQVRFQSKNRAYNFYIALNANAKVGEE